MHFTNTPYGRPISRNLTIFKLGYYPPVSLFLQKCRYLLKRRSFGAHTLGLIEPPRLLVAEHPYEIFLRDAAIKARARSVSHGIE